MTHREQVETFPEPKTPRDRQRVALWARIFLRSYGLLSEKEDVDVKKRIHQWQGRGQLR